MMAKVLQFPTGGPLMPDVEVPAVHVTEQIPVARPVLLHRGTGTERVKCWGAAVRGSAAGGDRITIRTRKGEEWEATVSAVVGGEYGETTVELVGNEWEPNPERAQRDESRARKA